VAVVAEPEPETPIRRRRRWPFIAGGTLGLVGVLAALWWFLWVPNWRPSLKEGERYGIDVSGHQDVIDWKRVADDGITFAYIKATEGGDFVDDRFRENWRNAGTAALDRGAYHFFTLCRPLWHRRFLRRPDVAGWVIWQLHGYAKVAGVNGGVDLTSCVRSDDPGWR
jgi:GH25 family lysozyme M1 (1,4-beta-N-acetylmuramidase)